MKITHIIPSAFDYFDDIRDRAFGWVEALGGLGVNVDVFTMQYGGKPPSEVREQVATVAPSREYTQTQSVQTMTKIMASAVAPKEAEIVHLHTPFLGGAREILRFINSRPDAKLVITHHRPVDLVDLFSVIIYFYNLHYLPKFFTRADAILEVTPEKRAREQLRSYNNKVFYLGVDKNSNPDYPHQISPESVAESLLMMYNKLTGD